MNKPPEIDEILGRIAKLPASREVSEPRLFRLNPLVVDPIPSGLQMNDLKALEPYIRHLEKTVERTEIILANLLYSVYGYDLSPHRRR